MQFSKTETEYNMKSIRFLLLTITTMFIIIAGLMIVLGMSVYTHYHGFALFYDSAKSARFFTPSVMCVLLGLVLLVVTSFGFFGSLKQSTCMVNLYALLLAVIFLLKLVVVILAFTTDAETVLRYIHIPIQSYTTDVEFQEEIDALQVSWNCCGSTSYLDYVGMEFHSNHTTVVFSRDIEGDIVTVVVPQSCCLHGGAKICNELRPNSCQRVIVNLVTQNASVIGVLGVSVMFIELLGITFALLLARCIRKLKSERALMLWRIKEQIILARQADDDQKSDPNTVYIAKPESSVA